MDIEKLKTLVRDNPVQAAAGALAVLLVAGVVAFTIYLNGQGNNKDFAVEGSRLIVVKDGMTTADIAELLHEKKLVKNPAAFKMEARWKGLATKLQAGAYQIDGGMSNQQIVDVMVKGRIKQVRFTVPEGYSVAKTAKKLEAEGLGSADKFMAAAKDYAPYSYMQTDDSNVFDCIVLAEEIFNLYRIDIFAAGDDDIFLTVNEIDKAVFVFLCHIAGEQPSIL